MGTEGNTPDEAPKGDNGALPVTEPVSAHPQIEPLASIRPDTSRGELAARLAQQKPAGELDSIPKPPEPPPVPISKDDGLSAFERKTIQYGKFGILVAFLALGAACATGYFIYEQFAAAEEANELAGIVAKKARFDSAAASLATTEQLRIAQLQANAAQNSIAVVAKQMRQDQRPWLRVEFVPTPWVGNDPIKPQATISLTTGQPIIVPIRIRNTGKTPALDITAYFLIQLATIDGDLPFLPEPGVERRVHKNRPKSLRPLKPATRATATVRRIGTGAIFPESFTEASLNRATLENGKELPLPLTLPEALEIARGKVLIYVIGRVEYFDEFGISHWTDFCHPTSDAPENRLCAEYNAADGN